jgi:prophage regulatory protein
MEALIWREREVKEKTGLSKSTRWRLEKAGQFPKKVQLSFRAVGWRAESIIEWCRNRDAATNEPVARKKTDGPGSGLSTPKGGGE